MTKRAQFWSYEKLGGEQTLGLGDGLGDCVPRWRVADQDDDYVDDFPTEQEAIDFCWEHNSKVNSWFQERLLAGCCPGLAIFGTPQMSVENLVSSVMASAEQKAVIDSMKDNAEAALGIVNRMKSRRLPVSFIEISQIIDHLKRIVSLGNGG